MLWSLVKINLKRLFAGANRSGQKKGMKILIICLLIYAVIVFGGLMASSFLVMYEPYHEAGLDWFYFSAAGIMSFGLCFMFSIFSTKSQLFEATDNDLLLSMPIPPMTILISRVISLLVLNYIYSSIVLIPAIGVYLLLGSLPVIGIVNFIIVYFTLPLLSLALSCLLGGLLAWIASKMRNKNAITLAMSMAFFVAYFWFYSHIQEYMTSLVKNGATLAEAVKRSMMPAYHMGQAIANGSAASMVILLIVELIPFAAVMYILSGSFISIATENKGAAKAVYREKVLKVSGVRAALLKKDFRAYLSSPLYIMNASLGGVFAVGLSIMAAVKLGDISAAVSRFNAMGFSLPIAAAAVLCLCVAMNMISAPSVSLEGKTLWICRTLPIPSGDILMSKALLHFVITEPGIIIGGAIFAVLLKPSPMELIMMLILPATLNAFLALLGVAVNLRFPRFDWTSEVQVIKQSATVLVTMLLNLAAVITPAIIYMAALSNRVSLMVFAVVCSVLYLLLAALLYVYLRGAGARRFESLS